MTPEQVAKIAQNRRIAEARKRGLTTEQIARMEESRRAAMARKRGLTPEQIARMEENRRAAIARKRGLDPSQLSRIEENRRKAMERRQQKQTDETPIKKEAKAVVETPTKDVAGGGAGPPAPKPVEERDARQKLVAQLLCRWWWALPAWPPENFDYDAELARHRLFRAEMTTFDQTGELDARGFRKAYELEQFKGCFRTSDGELLDTRPKEGRPSWDQLMLKTTPDLYRLLIAAFDGQLQELFAETQKENAPKDLEVHLQDLKKQATALRQKAMFFLQFGGGKTVKK